MQNKMQVFTNERFGNLRTVMYDGQPWFVAADVCRALEINNPSQALTRLDGDEKMTLTSNDGHSGQRGGARFYSLVNEFGLYTLILTSRKPEAHQFKRWITHEVIPAIRKHGAYFTDSMLAKLLSDPNQAHLLVMEYVKETLENEQLTMELQAALPKAAYFDTFVNPREATNIRTTAKELGVPEKRFTKYLLDNRYMYRAPSGKLMPYVYYYNKGFFIVRDYHKFNSPDVGQYTLFTAIGKEYFMHKVPEIMAGKP